MPSSYTPLGLILQETGENETTWGDFLNDGGLSLIDEAIRGRVAFVLSGSKTLTSTNGVDTEARKAILHATSGTGGTVTIPGYSKVYAVVNDTTGNMVVTSGGATNATIVSGDAAIVVCDGAGAVVALKMTDFGGSRLTNVGSPTSDGDAATKLYADNLAFTANAGILPGQPTNAGKYLTTDGTVASWGDPFPSQTGNAGKLLTTDGTDISWVDPDDRSAVQSSSVTGTVTLDLSTYRNFELTLTGNITLAVPTGMSSGASGVIWFIQDGTGSRSLTLNAAIKKPGLAPVLSTSAGTVDRIGYVVRGGALELTALERNIT